MGQMLGFKLPEVKKTERLTISYNGLVKHMETQADNVQKVVKDIQNTYMDLQKQTKEMLKGANSRIEKLSEDSTDKGHVEEQAQFFSHLKNEYMKKLQV